MQQPREHAGARRSVGFAEQVFGGIPAAEHRQVALDELLDAVRILVDAPEILVRGRRNRAGVARADGIDEHQVALVEQAVLVVLHGIRGRRGEARHARPDPPRAERSEQQEDRRRTRTAVIEERDRTRGRGRAVEREGHVEQLGGGLRAVRVGRHEVAGACRIGKRLSAELHRVMGDRRVLADIGHRIVRAIAVWGGVEQRLVGRDLLPRRCVHRKAPGSNGRASAARHSQMALRAESSPFPLGTPQPLTASKPAFAE